ncbi:uncharacterized protein LOC123378584 isoform X3 [Mauremys mutica]|uniref:uncharacterized protein LOC123378584 isoform X3 n=1 Tax=Mauremys mutica TaxID=74926 RepID=UPI001D144DF6|nr:uncharacterized protein LOC123378584 isoform X3 [Mauremys mutica]XP_044888530.1 uncharacterized protein LOC123378584 isoform X3 [Mauremys mutica]
MGPGSPGLQGKEDPKRYLHSCLATKDCADEETPLPQPLATAMREAWEESQMNESEKLRRMLFLLWQSRNITNKPSSQGPGQDIAFQTSWRPLLLLNVSILLNNVLSSRNERLQSIR